MRMQRSLIGSRLGMLLTSSFLGAHQYNVLEPSITKDNKLAEPRCLGAKASRDNPAPCKPAMGKRKRQWR